MKIDFWGTWRPEMCSQWATVIWESTLRIIRTGQLHPMPSVTQEHLLRLWGLRVYALWLVYSWELSLRSLGTRHLHQTNCSHPENSVRTTGIGKLCRVTFPHLGTIDAAAGDWEATLADLLTPGNHHWGLLVMKDCGQQSAITQGPLMRPAETGSVPSVTFPNLWAIFEACKAWGSTPSDPKLWSTLSAAAVGWAKNTEVTSIASEWLGGTHQNNKRTTKKCNLKLSSHIDLGQET